MDEISNKIREVMSVVFMVGPNDIADDCTYGVFEKWDSLASMNLVVALEEEFDIRIKDSDVEDMLSFRLVCDIVSSYLNNSIVI